MEDFVYDETKYIHKKELEHFEDLMLEYDFTPEDIDNYEEFQSVLLYLLQLTDKFPDFLNPYEYILSMLSLLETSSELKELKEDAHTRWIKACERVALKENIYSQTVEWGFIENRPLIRGLFDKANLLWESGKIKQANQLFAKIYKTNPNDNIGARYPLKATSEGMSFEEFENRFTYTDEMGSFYKNEELSEWYEEK